MLLKKDEIISIPNISDIPKYNEISIKNIWNEVKKDPYTLKHFPNYPKNVLPDRAYLLPVMI